MSKARWLSWAGAAALVAACGCASWSRDQKPERQAAAGAVSEETGLPERIPTGRDDGRQADKLIRGKVTAVDPWLGVVFLDVGDRQGVRRSDGFIVYRAKSYVGRLVIDQVYPDMSTARYGRSMMRQVEVGDEVTTKLFPDT